ncbi:hypothetical protein LguiA_034382 [Lonicera macranthoides]
MFYDCRFRRKKEEEEEEEEEDDDDDDDENDAPLGDTIGDGDAIVASSAITDWGAVWKRSRQIDVDTLCPLCNNAVESDLHSLVKCSIAKLIWVVSIVGDQLEGTNFIVDWWNKLRRRCTNDQLDSATMLLWYVWRNRNNRVRKNKQQPSAVVV